MPTVMNKESIKEIFEKHRANRFKVANTTPRERIKKLQKFYEALMAHQQDLRDALLKDFRKSPSETDINELYVVVTEIRHTCANLKDWMAPKKVDVTTALVGSESYVHHEPKGACLIISPWNYPVNLSLGPLVSAVAAGNTAIIKPSELTPYTNAVIVKIIEESFPKNEVCVIEGEVETAQELLALPFDHIFFTGSPRVGKLVMKAAAENLTSVTLELGGKSPVIVDETANLKEAAKKIVWGKLTNCGQTCVAPDYLLVSDKAAPELLRYMKECVREFYGETEKDRKSSPDLARIIDNKNFKRIKSLIDDAFEKGGKIEMGGITDENELYIAPTLITDLSQDAKILQEEIFGPVLPIVEYKTLGEALQIINEKEKPLALYIFSKEQHVIDTIMNYTSAGGTCINDTVVHFFESNLPFGGVNNSGIGKAHGHYGFLAFTNERGVLKQPTRYSAAQLMYPPYNPTKQTLIDLTIKWL